MSKKLEKEKIEKILQEAAERLMEEAVAEAFSYMPYCSFWYHYTSHRRLI